MQVKVKYADNSSRIVTVPDETIASIAQGIADMTDEADRRKSRKAISGIEVVK